MPSPQLTAFLDLIAWSEGTSTHPLTRNDGYDVIVTGADGAPEIFTDYADHPFAGGRKPKLIRMEPPPPILSDAAGRYQQMLKYWPAYKAQLELPDFGPASQDKLAIQLITECRAIRLIEAGQVTAAIAACSSRWASFPGNNYGQGGRKIEELMARYPDLLIKRQEQVTGASA
ncbi:glycoside hydrolase family 104 protein [Acidicapsa dinghuensis]|uniref:Glycoside hydrolase family 104 protein n=1 Tax=Acidicapsa dinghuensis TaxID=2218256 RepID=A0ABW1E9V3_9BACT|nr:glycoside hydrolase family 104 protein [Acidicapsa dinghuensis]